MLTEYPHASPRQALRCHWPQEFTKRRNFSRQAENQPYIEWLQAVFDYGDEGEGEGEGEDEDEAESEGEDESDEEEEEAVGAGPGDGLGNVRRFMKGMEGDEDALEYRDQVEHVSRFCEQASLSESEQRVALLDDRNDGGSSLDKHFKTYQGPLTPQQLREELSKKRFKVESVQASPPATVLKPSRSLIGLPLRMGLSMLSLRRGLSSLRTTQTKGEGVSTDSSRDEGGGAERRVLFIKDLDPSTINSLASTAPRSHAPALKDLFYKHLAGKTSIGVTIPSQGFRIFTLDFHIPYFVLKQSQEPLKDSRKKFDGQPLRQSWDLSFLSGPTNASRSMDIPYYLYEAQISVAVTGIDHWVWTAYGFVDTYFGSKESVKAYHQLKARTGRPDPLAAGQLPVDFLIWTPREYFFKVFEIRIKEVRSQWHIIIDTVGGAVKKSRTNHVFLLVSNDPKTRQELREFSDWSAQMVKLLTQLINGLSETVGAWDEFEQYEIGHFLFDGEFAMASSTLKSSIAAVRRVFSDLKILLRKLEQLERELCKDNPQGLNAYLSFQSHEAAVFQQRTASHIEVLTVITIVTLPLGLAAAMFSTQGVLPFTPNLARFTGVIFILSILVVATVVFLFNWVSWFPLIIEYLKNFKNFRKATIYYNEGPVEEGNRDPTTTPRALEEGIIPNDA